MNSFKVEGARNAFDLLALNEGAQVTLIKAKGWFQSRTVEIKCGEAKHKCTLAELMKVIRSHEKKDWKDVTKLYQLRNVISKIEKAEKSQTHLSLHNYIFGRKRELQKINNNLSRLEHGRDIFSKIAKGCNFEIEIGALGSFFVTVDRLKCSADRLLSIIDNYHFSSEFRDDPSTLIKVVKKLIDKAKESNIHNADYPELISTWENKYDNLVIDNFQLQFKKNSRAAESDTAKAILDRKWRNSQQVLIYKGVKTPGRAAKINYTDEHGQKTKLTIVMLKYEDEIYFQLDPTESGTDSYKNIDIHAYLNNKSS